MKISTAIKDKLQGLAHYLAGLVINEKEWTKHTFLSPSFYYAILFL
jgi:hypothetical protein